MTIKARPTADWFNNFTHGIQQKLSAYVSMEDIQVIVDAVWAADREASEARERVLKEALEPFAVAAAEPTRCGSCHWLLAACADDNCRGFLARRALATVAKLREESRR